jgi:predicted choloylglycine hydrolase
MQEITVDLSRSPRERWELSTEQIQQARELLAFYKKDLGVTLPGSMRELVSPDHWAELEGLSAVLAVPMEDVTLGNFYYDALKSVIGCTAFGVETEQGILHARNLDWWSEEARLSRYSALCHFRGAPAGDFVTVGWPGFIGAFSGLAAGRFAVTLNAVLSFDSVLIATPIVLQLRQVLETCHTFEQALDILSTVPLPSDCLLLLSGTRRDELAVIERTPVRSGIRRAASGFVAVTNDYQCVNVELAPPTSALQAPSCGRFQRVQALLNQTSPRSLEECLSYLSDPGVVMACTMQQMAFNSSTGDYVIRVP